MSAVSTILDERARRIIRALEPCLRSHLTVPRIGAELIGELYLRLRNQLDLLEKNGGPDDTRVADELALQVYMAVVAEETGETAKPELLTDLRHSLIDALETEARGIAERRKK